MAAKHSASPTSYRAFFHGLAPIRTSTPAISSSMPSTCARRRTRRGALISTAGSRSTGSTTAGTNIVADDKAACLASRRQVNNCCGVSARRRATLQTVSPAP